MDPQKIVDVINGVFDWLRGHVQGSSLLTFAVESAAHEATKLIGAIETRIQGAGGLQAVVAALLVELELASRGNPYEHFGVQFVAWLVNKELPVVLDFLRAQGISV